MRGDGMSQREKLIYSLGGVLFLGLLVVGGLWALLGPEEDVEAVVDAAAGDRIVFRVDLFEAFERADTAEGVAVPVPPDVVLAGDPEVVRGAGTTRSGLEVEFEGYWPMGGGYPLVLNRDGIAIRSHSELGRNGEQVTRIRFPGNSRSVGVVTFILGECVGESHLPAIAAACEGREGHVGAED